MKNGQLASIIAFIIIITGYLAFATYSELRAEQTPPAVAPPSGHTELPRVTTRTWSNARPSVSELSDSSNATNRTNSSAVHEFVPPDFGAVPYDDAYEYALEHPAREEPTRTERAPREREEVAQTPANDTNSTHNATVAPQNETNVTLPTPPLVNETDESNSTGNETGAAPVVEVPPIDSSEPAPSEPQTPTEETPPQEEAPPAPAQAPANETADSTPKEEKPKKVKPQKEEPAPIAESLAGITV